MDRRSVLLNSGGRFHARPVSQQGNGEILRSRSLFNRSQAAPSLPEISRRDGLFSRVDTLNVPRFAPRAGQDVPQRSMLITERDREMASRQTRIKSLPLDQRREQEAWAQTQLRKLPGTCRYGDNWKRVKDGYRCKAKVCLVTDELLAEGRGGYYELCQKIKSKNPKRHGPYYPGSRDLFTPQSEANGMLGPRG